MYTRPSGSIETDSVFTNLTFEVLIGPNNKRFILFNAIGTDRDREFVISYEMLLENDQTELLETTGTVVVFER
jgi:hypothetical protein